MKFARYLEDNAQPEWQRAYIKYRGLKKLVKLVEVRRKARLAKQAAALQLSRQNTASSVSGFLRRRTLSRASSGTIPRLLRAGTLGLDTRGGEDADVEAEAEVQAGPSGSRLQTPRREEEQPRLFTSAVDASNDRVRFAHLGQHRLNQFGRPRPTDGVGEAAELDDGLPVVSLAGTGLRIDARVTPVPLSPNEKTAPPGVRSAEEEAELGEAAHTGSASDDTRVGSTGLARKSSADTQRSGLKQATQIQESDVAEERHGTFAGGLEEAVQEASEEAKKDKGEGKKAAKKGKGKGKKKKNHDVTQKKGDELLHIIEDDFDLEERKFFAALDAELDRIVKFYREREAEFTARFEILARQLKELAEHRRAFNRLRDEEDRRNGLNLSKIGSTVISSLPGRRSLETDGANFNRIISSLQQSSPPSGSRGSHPVASAAAEDEGDRRRSMAFQHIPEELRESILHADQERRDDIKAAALSRDPERYKAARKKLKVAVLEFYKGLEILKNYAILNRTGFAKIMKKAEKTWEVSVADVYYEARVAPSRLVTSQIVEKLIHSTEEIYTAYFEHGDRKKALNRLRVSVTGYAAQHPAHHLSVFKAGLFLGVSICATVAALVLALHPDTRVKVPQWESLLRVYGAFYIPTVFALLFGLNLSLWKHERINWPFIFETDPRHTIDEHQYWQMPSLILLILSIFMWLSFLDPLPTIEPTTWPVVFLVCLIAFFINPLPFFLIESRKWFVRSLFRVFTGGMIPTTAYSVQFRDFFLGDELNSLAFTISTLWFLGCQYHHHWAIPNQCDPNRTYWTAVLSSVPAFLRFTQCFRRWSDSKYEQRIHLINAGKYTSVILQQFLYLHWRYNGSRKGGALALWVVFACIYSIYTSSWDILLDWSLGKPNSRNKFLRDELCYEGLQWWYYASVIVNIILRFSWFIYLLPGPATPLTRVFIIALLEMLRRVNWNFFRLETEHLGNADTYRITKDVPLPYQIARGSEGEEDPESMQSSLRLATLRKRLLRTNSDNKERRTDSPLGDSDRDSSDAGGSTVFSRARDLGNAIAKRLEPTVEGHMRDPARRDYAPRRAEVQAHDATDANEEDDSD